MKATLDFSPIAPDEELDLAIDFTAYLAASDSVASITAWNCTVADGSQGVDPTPSSRLIGGPQLSQNIVVQKVGGCVVNTTYVMEALVSTVLGEELSIWSLITCIGVGSA